MDVIAFGGSVEVLANFVKNKKCKSPCVNPEKGRIPMKATGINVVETCRKFGLRLRFPAVGKLWRIGLILVI
jgi:predicted metal-binding protein